MESTKSQLALIRVGVIPERHTQDKLFGRGHNVETRCHLILVSQAVQIAKNGGRIHDQGEKEEDATADDRSRAQAHFAQELRHDGPKKETCPEGSISRLKKDNTKSEEARQLLRNSRSRQGVAVRFEFAELRKRSGAHYSPGAEPGVRVRSTWNPQK